MVGKKTNNHRTYPDANHQPCQDASFRKADADARQKAYDELTLEQKIEKLPPEPYSKKQRAKLMAQLEKKNMQAAPKKKEEDKK
jgi:hypothetical protein